MLISNFKVTNSLILQSLYEKFFGFQVFIFDLNSFSCQLKFILLPNEIAYST